jgi:hypothetical protein
MKRTRFLTFLVATVTVVLSAAPPVHADGLRFELTYDPAITETFSGRVYVMLSARNQEPRHGPRWFGTEPFFATDVEDWTPGDTMVIDERADGFPAPVSDLEPNEYWVQAVMRRNLDSPSIGRGEGTAYSASVKQGLGPGTGALALHLDKLVEGRVFPQNDRVRLVELRSELLSDFYGRDVYMMTAVILPEGHDAAPAGTRFPALYWIGGFGASYRSAHRMQRVFDASSLSDRIVRVVLDPACYGGHHVFADSANNGPRGQALVEELIPHLEATYPLVAAPTARFLSGHSSGGWSSLWLQVAYPDFFGGTWSLAPDPVDFATFQGIDLYAAGTNMYRDEAGKPRPIARRGETPFGWYEPFGRMEAVYGDGGQLRSFDWVFSPRGADGKPLRLFDPATGNVDPEVAEHWKRYDIRLILEENWRALGPRLAGKLHVIAGELDTFYLESAVITLKRTLEDLGSDAVIEIVEGADHGSFATPELRERIDRELLVIFERNHVHR